MAFSLIVLPSVILRPTANGIPNALASNVATEGGGIFLRAQSRTNNQFLLQQVNISGNAAVPDFADLVASGTNRSKFLRDVLGDDRFNVLQSVVEERLLALDRLTALFGDSAQSVALEAADSNLTVGGGGGALLGLTRGPTQGSVDAELEGSQFDKNVADFGGMNVVDLWLSWWDALELSGK